MNKKAGEKLLDAREKKGWTQAVMAEKVGFSTKQLQKYEQGNFPKYNTSTIKTIDSLLGTRLYEEIYEQSVPLSELQEGAAEYKLQRASQGNNAFTSQSINRLLDDHHTLVESNKEAIHANRTLSDTNRDLVLIIKSQFNSTDQSTPDLSIGELMKPYLDQIAEAGVSNGLWKTKKEALLFLGKSLKPKIPETLKQGMHKA